MSNYHDQFKRRMQANAGRPADEFSEDSLVTLREAQISRAVDSQRATFFDSPTLTYVQYNDTYDIPVIQSNRYRNIELQTFLFEPLRPVKIGSLIKDGEYTYLAIEKNGDKIYPELTAKLCNDHFDIPIGEAEEKETQDRFGNPIYTSIPNLEQVPAVISDKDYSTSSNSVIPLPAGRINVEIPYKKEYLEYFKINFVFDHSAGSYQVTDIREYRATPDPDEKYIKISATRVQSDGEVSHDE